VALRIERPTTDDDLTTFLTFADRINERLDAYWPVIVPMTLPLLRGEGPSAHGKTVLPLVAKSGDEIVARVLAIVDQAYIDHWGEPLGFTGMFESKPGATDAVRMLMDEACGFLRENGMEAARCGFGNNDFPFVIDAHETLPPILMRQNPPYYHTLLKEAGFESERAWTDYKAAVTPDLVRRWEGFLADGRTRGFDIVPLGQVDEARRVDDLNDTWNDAFSKHWGVVPTKREEQAERIAMLGPMGAYDLTVLAYRDDEPVGMCFVTPESASAFAVKRRELRPDEKLNFLGIGVREQARRQGVNLAMASYAYLQLVARGATHVSYTLVLDDNWPSRRTAEKLGCSICANYMVYRRNFKR
jgi:hypothetical protein